MVYRLLALMILVAAACTPQVTEPTPTLATLPTEAETATPEPTRTPVVRATLPPTWTPEGETTSPVDESQPDVAATSTSGPTVPPPVIPPTALEVCRNFGEDLQLNSRTFPIGTAPTVYWTPVEGAVQYSITLVDENGESLLVDYTAETNFTFEEDLFESRRLYGWEVYPIDVLGQQMCLSRGAELMPEGIRPDEN